MRAVVQRVSRARVTVDGRVTGEIGRGLLVLLGVSVDDNVSAADYLLEKITSLRIFDDADGKMNLSLVDIDGGLLIVSQFTLYGDTRRGRRPSFIAAARGQDAIGLYEHFVAEARGTLANVATGEFGAMMDVELVNDGPVTIILDSEKTI
ncbi:MAG: D-tyrosyl-tRNA(Tyr) deacylase [Acidobacteria bacterium]|nr:D-tyrosyl-tRNA(Tyr) deacylase [Acidobacteriota bacterium]MBK9527225.1 D-tyrosyl-tRNA(Tyr) deacylase [Acidobacteriota bacterium]MBP7474503.1 D-tyrosyl-tRNA(Tyr) deacylase [Pyrinomonadaceae bacterium]MBP9108213.1 D-tyrosyl-tRNA(Tyr) deacylase [Pyrinomonadaceae bacterium]